MGRLKPMPGVDSLKPAMISMSCEIRLGLIGILHLNVERLPRLRSTVASLAAEAASPVVIFRSPFLQFVPVFSISLSAAVRRRRCSMGMPSAHSCIQSRAKMPFFGLGENLSDFLFINHPRPARANRKLAGSAATLGQIFLDSFVRPSHRITLRRLRMALRP